MIKVYEHRQINPLIDDYIYRIVIVAKKMS